jgi:hypothetical protein
MDLENFDSIGEFVMGPKKMNLISLVDSRTRLMQHAGILSGLSCTEKGLGMLNYSSYSNGKVKMVTELSQDQTLIQQ